MSDTIVDEIRGTARARPDHPAVIQENGPTLSYARLVERLERRRDELERQGLRPGERCGLMGESGAAFLVQALAALDAGLCLVPVAQNRWEKRLSEVVERLSLQHVMTGGDFTPTSHDQPLVPGDASEEAYRSLGPAYIRMTSGTTGDRKGVLLGHETILRRTEAVNRSLSLGPDDRVLWVLSMANHFVSSILLYLRHGATILAAESHLAEPLLDFARENGATFLYATPYHYDRLAGEPSDRGLPDVRRAVSTATGLEEAVAGRFRDRYGLPLCQALGIIECGLPAINVERPVEKPLSVGQVQPPYEVRLRDEDGEAWGPGTTPDREGEIQVGGPGLFDAYFAPWTPAEAVLEEGYFPTGDQGTFDEDGDLFLVGRRVNRINMAGMKFFCEEVESVLNRHPSVAASRVYGEPHDRLGEIPRARVVPSDPSKTPDENELRAYCGDRLPTHQVPRSFEVVDELPRTPTGKIKRSGGSERTDA